MNNSLVVDILYPNKEMVTFRAPINDPKKNTKEGDEIQVSTKTIDCSINGYSINEGVDILPLILPPD